MNKGTQRNIYWGGTYNDERPTNLEFARGRADFRAVSVFEIDLFFMQYRADTSRQIATEKNRNPEFTLPGL